MTWYLLFATYRCDYLPIATSPGAMLRASPPVDHRLQKTIVESRPFFLIYHCSIPLFIFLLLKFFTHWSWCIRSESSSCRAQPENVSVLHSMLHRRLLRLQVRLLLPRNQVASSMVRQATNVIRVVAAACRMHIQQVLHAPALALQVLCVEASSIRHARIF